MTVFIGMQIQWKRNKHQLWIQGKKKLSLWITINIVQQQNCLAQRKEGRPQELLFSPVDITLLMLMAFLQQIFHINHVSSLVTAWWHKRILLLSVIYLKLTACIGFISFQLTGKKLIKNVDLCSDVHFSDGVKTFKSSLLSSPIPDLCNVLFLLF